MTHLAYRVGIDLGTTYSAAAVCRVGDPRPQVVTLGGLAAPVASMVFLAPDGDLLCGEPAQRRAVTDPRRVVREFKRRIGDGTPLVVGGNPVPAETVAARFVEWMLSVVAQREGGPAERFALTHPAEWGPHKRQALATALAAQDLPEVEFLSEPEAAAIGYASTARVEVGDTVAVYDLGGGTFDAAVVRKLPDGGFELVGTPVGIEHLGGVDFDQAVFDHVRDAVGEAWEQLDPADPAVQSAVAGLRRECTAAKEALSADTEVLIPVMLPGAHQQVRLGRAEFEEVIRPAVVETVEALRRALDTAGVPEPDAVLLVGGSSRIPLVAQLVSAELGRPVAIDADPKSVIAAGAAVAARGPVSAPAADPDATIVLEISPTTPPPSRPTDLEPAPSERGDRPARPRRGPILALATAAALVTAMAVGAVPLIASEAPLAAPGDPISVAPQPAPEGATVDPWTGGAVTDTTPPGPRRPQAVAAASRPVARFTPTGAGGASAATGPAQTTDGTAPPAGVVAPSAPTSAPVGGSVVLPTSRPATPSPGTLSNTLPTEASEPPVSPSATTRPSVPPTPPANTAPPELTGPSQPPVDPSGSPSQAPSPVVDPPPNPTPVSAAPPAGDATALAGGVQTP